MSRFNPSQIGELQKYAVSVDWYGAKGDGTTDDTTAFQDAINANAGKNYIQLSEGKTYLINGSINLKTGTWLKGKNVTLILGAGTSAQMFNIDAACTGNISFEGITFNGNDSVPDTMTNNNAKGTRIFIHGIFPYLNNSVANVFTVRDCVFTNLAGYAVFLSGCGQVTIENCQFTNLYNAIQVGTNGDYTNYTTRAISGVSVRHNYFYNCSAGPVIQGLSDVTLGSYKPSGWIYNVAISDNHLERLCGIIMEFYAMVDGGIMANNYATRCTASGVTPPICSIKLSRDCVVKNNFLPLFGIQGDNTDVNPNTSAAYAEFNMDNIEICGNTIIGDTTASSTQVGLTLWRQMTNVYIHDNIITSCYSALTVGMTSTDQTNYPNESQSNIKIVDNSFHDNTTHGMDLYTFSYGVINDNKIFNNGDTTDNNGLGLRVNQNADHLEIINNRIVDTNTGANRKQAVGIYLQSGITLTNCDIRNNYLDNNKNSNLYNPINQVVKSRDYKQVSATSSATAGTQTTVAHGLGYTPTELLILQKGAGTVYSSAASDSTNIYVTGTAASLPFVAYVR